MPMFARLATAILVIATLAGCGEENTTSPGPVNHSPVAVAGPDQAVAVGDTVHLDASASSDPDDDALGYLWVILSSPSSSTAALTDSSIANPGFVADQPGEYVVALGVSDGALADIDTLVVTATEPPVDMVLIAADRNGDIYSLDVSTGVESPLLDTWYTVPVARGLPDLGVVSAMLYVPARGELWAGAGGESFAPASVLVIDTITGEAIILHDNSGETPAIPDLAHRASDGAIFAPGADGNGFFGVDPATGVFTEINPATPSSQGNGMTFGTDGVLYLASDQTLYAVDPGDGTAVAVGGFTYQGFPGFVGEPSIGSLTTRTPDGTVFGILKDGGGTGGAGPTYLVTIDTGTAVVTNVGVNGVKLDGLAFVPVSLFD